MAWERIQSVDEDVQILHYVMIGCYAARKIMFMKFLYCKFHLYLYYVVHQMLFVPGTVLTTRTLTYVKIRGHPL